MRVRVESGEAEGEDLEEQPAARGMGPRRSAAGRPRAAREGSGGGGRAVAVAGANGFTGDGLEFVDEDGLDFVDELLDWEEEEDDGGSASAWAALRWAIE